jgi:hypothetical protein
MMSKFLFEIALDNDEFYGEGFVTREAVRRAVERAAGVAGARISDGETEGTLRDVNGNTIGKWELS